MTHWDAQFFGPCHIWIWRLVHWGDDQMNISIFVSPRISYAIIILHNHLAWTFLKDSGVALPKLITRLSKHGVWKLKVYTISLHLHIYTFLKGFPCATVQEGLSHIFFGGGKGGSLASMFVQVMWRLVYSLLTAGGTMLSTTALLLLGVQRHRSKMLCV